MIKHIAFIMDGNRRYGKKQNISIEEAYKKGMEKFIEFLGFQVKYNLPETSFFALSSDNYIKRLDTEKNILYNLIEFFCENQKINTFILNNKIKVILKGNIDEITTKEKKLSLKKKIFIEKLENKIKEWNFKIKNPEFKVNIALNYDGHTEILHSFQKILKKIKLGYINENEITEKDIKENLWFSENGPEIIVRPGNAPRLSGFILWDSKYSEIYLSPKLWPELNETDFLNILDWYKNIQRNFGV